MTESVEKEGEGGSIGLTWQELIKVGGDQVNKAKLEGLIVFDWRGCQHHLTGLLEANEPGETLGAPKARDDTQAQLRQAQTSPRSATVRKQRRELRGKGLRELQAMAIQRKLNSPDPGVAAHGDFKPSAQGDSVDGCHGRLGPLL